MFGRKKNYNISDNAKFRNDGRVSSLSAFINEYEAKLLIVLNNWPFCWEKLSLIFTYKCLLNNARKVLAAELGKPVSDHVELSVFPPSDSSGESRTTGKLICCKT